MACISLICNKNINLCLHFESFNNNFLLFLLQNIQYIRNMYVCMHMYVCMYMYAYVWYLFILQQQHTYVFNNLFILFLLFLCVCTEWNVFSYYFIEIIITGILYFFFSLLFLRYFFAMKTTTTFKTKINNNNNNNKFNSNRFYRNAFRLYLKLK